MSSHTSSFVGIWSNGKGGVVSGETYSPLLVLDEVSVVSVVVGVEVCVSVVVVGVLAAGVLAAAVEVVALLVVVPACEAV